LKDNNCGTKYVITEFDVREVAFNKHKITRKLVITITFCASIPSVTLGGFMDCLYSIGQSSIFLEIWSKTRFELSATIVEVKSWYTVGLNPIIGQIACRANILMSPAILEITFR
jgi:hypothetical protein